MATALHIHANLVWRAGSPESRIKRFAALRLLTEPHYRLPLEDLSKALASSLGSAVAPELLKPAHLAEVFDKDPCFSHSGVTGNVLIDAAALLGAGKACLKEFIDRRWDAASPLSWARRQLAWYIVSRQQIDTQAADLFWAPVDDAESFLAAAWTARMELRDHPGPSYKSLEQLLSGEPLLEVLPDQRVIKLVFSALVNPACASPLSPAGSGTATNIMAADNTMNGSKHETRTQIAAAPSREDSRAPAQQPGNIKRRYLDGNWADMVEVASASDGSGVGTNCGSGAGGGEDASWVAELSSGLRRTHLSQPPLAQPLTSSHEGPTGVRARSSQISHHVTNGTGDGQDADTPYVDDLAYEYTYDGYDNLGDDDAAMHDDHDGDDPAADPDLGEGYGPDRSYMTAPQSAAPVAPHALTTGTGPANPPWPLRPELLPVYVRAVFSGRGLTDQLMVSVALTLVDAGRGGQGGQRGGGQGQGQPGASAGYAPYEPQRFRLPLSRLLAQVRETAPHLLQALGVAEAQGSGGGGGGVEALRQRLMERPSRGCFRLVPMGAGAGEGAEREEKGGGGGGQENSGEEAVVLDLSVLREWVVEVLTTASQTVFAGPRKVDLIRRTAAMHLATRTRSFGGRAHCVRLTVLARILAESLPDHVDPNRLTGFARMINAEFTSNVLHVFKRVLASPAGQRQDRGGGGVEEGTTCVTLNVGRLLSTAASGGISGSGGGEYGGGSTAGAAATRAGGAGGGGTPTGQSGWPQRIPSDADSAPSGHTTAVGGGAVSSPSCLSYSGPGRSSHGGGAGEPAASLPPSAASPPTEVALTAAVAALFPAPLPTSRQAPVLAAKRTAALALVKALHSQPGGLLPMGRLMDIVNTHVPGALPGAQSLENLLAADPDVFEMQEHWPNGPCGIRLRAAGVMARAARLPSSARAAVGPGAGDAARGSGYFTPTVSAVTAPPAGPPAPTPALSTAPAAAAGPEGGLPQRPGVQNCPYYMKHGTCGYGANCKYNHPALTTAHHHTAPQQEQPAKSPTAAAAAAATVLAAAAAAAASTAHNCSGGAGPPPSSSQQQPPPHPSQQQSWQPGYYHPPATEAVPHERPIHAPPPSSGPAPPSPPTAASTPLLPTSAPTSAPAPAPGSPLTIEVKVVTGVCTPDHLDMLQHCFAAGQVAIGCKVAASYHSDGSGASGASTPCLVQLFANAAGSASASQQQQPQQPQGSRVSGAGRSAGSAAGGSGGGGGGEPRWPATVYLVDPTGARGDKGGLLLASLSALLEDPAVSKVIYCGAEVVPYLVRSCGAARIAPLHDISVLHAMLTAASGVVPTVGDGPGGPSTPPPPPATTPLLSLGSLLQQHGVMTPAGAAAVSVAPPHSQLWTARPLSPELRQQAVLEVVHLGALWAGLMGRLTALPQQLSQTAADRLVRSPSPTSIQIHAQNPNHPAPSNPPPPNPTQPHGHVYTHPQGHQTHSHGIPHLRTATHAEATAAILQSLRSPPAAAGASRVVPPAGHGGREPQSYGPSPPPRGLVGVQRWHPGM